MKKLFLIFIVLLFVFGCENPVQTPEIQRPGGLTPEIETPVFEFDVIMGLYDGTNLRFWDGNQLHDAYSGNIKSAGHRKLAIDNVLLYFDEKGNVIQSNWLPAIPEALKAVPKSISTRGDIVYQDDVHTLENIPPAEAYALGARYMDYTKIYYNSVEVGAWYLNEWKVDYVIETLSGHIIAIDTDKHYHNLTDSKNIYYAMEGGLLFYDIDEVNLIGKIADETGIHNITWTMGYFSHSQWQKAGNKWYSNSGYTFDSVNKVISNANKMFLWNDWNTLPAEYDAFYRDMPRLLAGCVREENSEEVTYWIECVTGYLWRHIPSTDQLSRIAELFEGPYTFGGASPFFNTLDPELIEDKLYFHEGGSIKTYDFTTGLVSIFSTEQQIISW